MLFFRLIFQAGFDFSLDYVLVFVFSLYPLYFLFKLGDCEKLVWILLWHVRDFELSFVVDVRYYFSFLAQTLFFFFGNCLRGFFLQGLREVLFEELPLIVDLVT